MFNPTHRHETQLLETVERLWARERRSISGGRGCSSSPSEPETARVAAEDGPGGEREDVDLRADDHLVVVGQIGAVVDANSDRNVETADASVSRRPIKMPTA